MDLLEQIVENRVQNREDLQSCKENLQQYEILINQLAENCEEIQSRYCYNIEVLEINNMTKNAFNKNFKEVKDLIGIIYKHLQEIDENSLTQKKQTVEDFCNRLTERFKNLGINITNKLQGYETKKKDIKEQIFQEMSELEQQIKIVDNEYEKCSEKWHDTFEEYEEKQKELQSVKLQIEIMQDNIDKEVQEYEALLLKKEEANGKLLAEITSTSEINDRILEVEENILQMTNQMREISVQKEELIRKKNQEKLILEGLKNECRTLETEITKCETENKQRVESITNETEIKKKLLEENEVLLTALKVETDDIGKEIENLKLKISAIDAEIVIFQQGAENDKAFLEENDVQKLSEENEQLIKECEHLKSQISQCNNEINRKSQEIATLKSNPNLELLQLQEQLKTLEEDRLKNINTEKEIEELELKNKNLQQSVEEYQNVIKDYSAQKTRIEQELDENKKELANVTKQCEVVENEIQLLEQQSIKSPPRSVQHTVPEKIKQTSAKSTRKRESLYDADSDSSVDGVTMSYAQFMAAKKKMRTKNSDKKN